MKAEKHLVAYYDNPLIFKNARKISLSEVEKTSFMEKSSFFDNKEYITQNWIREFALACQPNHGENAVMDISFANDSLLVYLKENPDNILVTRQNGIK